MIAEFLRRLDTDDAIIMDVFGESQQLVNTLTSEELKTPLFNRFLTGLVEDVNGNMQYHFKSHHINLQQSACPSCHHHVEDKVTITRDELKLVKGKVIENLIENRG